MMPAVIQAPLQMVESVASLRFPPRANRRLQALMDRNNEGGLTVEEREELEALAELSESMALVRSQAMHLLEQNTCGRTQGSTLQIAEC